MEYLTVHFANNDTQVSTVGNFTNPISFRLRLDLSEEKAVRLYARTPNGYISTNTVVSIEALQSGQTTTRWQLAPDVNGNPGTYGQWGASLNLGTVTPSRVYFWVKARQLPSDTVQNDSSVGLRIQGIIEAV